MSGIPSWARVGAKVVCVKAHEQHDLLVVGQTYHIASFAPSWRGRATVVIAEHRNPCDDFDGSYYLDRFRPLHTLETDIATHFRQHLDVREPEGV